METMYDRLGDLLNETLEAGHVKFVKPPVENKNAPFTGAFFLYLSECNVKRHYNGEADGKKQRSDI